MLKLTEHTAKSLSHSLFGSSCMKLRSVSSVTRECGNQFQFLLLIPWRQSKAAIKLVSIFCLRSHYTLRLGSLNELKDANFRKSLSRGFILSMVLLSLRSLGNPLRSTCNTSMNPVAFRKSEFWLCFWIALLESIE